MALKIFTFILSIFLLSAARPPKEPVIISSLEIFTLETGNRKMMPLAGGQPKVIAKLFGGQGTINVPFMVA